MPTTCNIEFEDNPIKVVYAGQLLRGTVELTLTNPKNVCGVYVRIYGFASVQWKEGRRERTGQEDYINERMYFVGERSGEVQLMPGTHKYTFQCQLPNELPTSAEGRYGHVRYNVRVVIDRPMWPDKKFKVPFTVIKAINLSEFPSLREPVIVEKSEKIYPCYVLCCVSDPVKIVARTKLGGYTPGEIINVEININNQSNVPIVQITAELIKQLIYFKSATGKNQRWESIQMIKKTAEGCNEHQEKAIDVSLEVPRTVPSDYTSNLLKVKYLIRVIASTPIFYSKFKLIIPIVIGSNLPQGDQLTENVYSHSSAVSTDNVILTQPSILQLPNENSGFKSSDRNDSEDPPNYADDPPTYGSLLKTKYPAIKIAPPSPNKY